MYRHIFLTVMLAGLLGFTLPLAAQPQNPRPEPAGAVDHPLVGRYEGSRIRGYQQTAFEQVRVITGPVKQRRDLNPDNSVDVAGRQTTIVYEGPDGRSPLEIMQNFEQAMTGRGFERLFGCHQESCGDRGGSELWFALISKRALGTSMMAGWKSGRYGAFRLKRPQGDVLASIYVQEVAYQNAPARIQTRVEVVEARAMDSGRISVVGAADLKTAIDTTGRVALYGIYFDLDAADVKPESAPQMDAIVAFLRAEPAIGVVVAGHTDSQGAFDYNVALSQRRAQAVSRALQAQGIAAARITTFGAGMAAPLASNQTAEGQARNRRVEIVRR